MGDASEPVRATFGVPGEAWFGHAQAVRSGRWIHVAGQVGRDPARADLAGRAAEAFECVARAVALAGGGRVVSLQVHAEDLDTTRAGLVAALHGAAAGLAEVAATVLGVRSLASAAYRLEVSAVAVAPGWPVSAVGGPEPPLGAPAAVAAGGLLHVGGLMALDAAGRAAPADDAAGQLGRVLDRLAALLASAGVGPADVLSTQVFIVGSPGEVGLEGIAAAHRAAFAPGEEPASTLVFVPALAVPGALAQVAAVARMPSSDE